jgi:hypothetical protein
MTWNLFNVPTVGDYHKKHFSICKSANTLLICIEDKVIVYNDKLEIEETIDIKPPYGSYEWHPSKDNHLKGWMKWHQNIYSVPNLKDFKTWINCGRCPVTYSIHEDKAVVLAGRGLSGRIINIKGESTPFDFTNHPLLTKEKVHEYAYNFPILIGDSIFIGLKEGFKNSSEYYKNYTTPANGFLEINLVTKQVIDHTYNLDGTNMTGNQKTVSSVVVIFNRDTNTFYATTEQWTYKKAFNDKVWTKIQQSWGSSLLYNLGDKEIVCIPRRTKNNIRVEKDNYLYLQPDLPVDDTTIKNIVKIGNKLVALTRKGDGNDIKVYVLPTINYVKEPQPKSAQYLNISNPKDVVDFNNKVLLAAGNIIYEVTLDSKTVFAQFNENVLSIRKYSDVALLVSKVSSLVLYDVNSKTEKLLFTYPAKADTSTISTNGAFISVINDDKLFVLNNEYKIVHQIAEVGTFIKDSLFFNNKLYVVGFFNRKNKTVPVQVPLFREYDLSNFNTFKKLWETDPSKLDKDMADNRLYKVYQYDGKIYVLGESAGGNAQFRWNALDLSTKTINDGSDWWSHAVQTASNHITYVGMIDPVSFKVVRGQFILTRLSNMKGNTIRANSLYVDKLGVYVGGIAAAYIHNRDITGVLGKQPAIYRGGDASLLKLNVDLTGSRLGWFTPGNGKKVNAYTSKYAIIATDNVGDMITNAGECDKSIDLNTYLISW